MKDVAVPLPRPRIRSSTADAPVPASGSCVRYQPITCACAHKVLQSLPSAATPASPGHCVPRRVLPYISPAPGSVAPTWVGEVLPRCWRPAGVFLHLVVSLLRALFLARQKPYQFPATLYTELLKQTTKQAQQSRQLDLSLHPSSQHLHLPELHVAKMQF